ncbi:MAG: NADH-quinone oxidoreductase subunit N [Phycisphaerales bacterium JB039]
MIEKIAYIWPEIALFLTTCIVMVVGLSPEAAIRKLCGPIAGAGLIVAFVLALTTGQDSGGAMPYLAPFFKASAAAVGLALLLAQTGVVDRREEADIAGGLRRFNPLRTTRAEYYALFLFSITGLMLCASAADLIWMFLALELTSLPTYVMVAISSHRKRAQEAAVKYFFLGALGAAIFLYGFVLLYGGTGATRLTEISAALAGDINPLAMAGLLLAIIGVSFKIAAVPMHFYTPDVYQGAAAPVAAMLGYVPKAAGFVTIILLLTTVGWDPGLPQEIRVLLWVMAALTMTFGNVLALLQTSVKRMLAYSSIAHSGYILVGVIAGPGIGGFWSSGIGAVLFYLLGYGLTNAGAFAVLAALERKGADGEPEEIETFDDLRGLCATHPLLGWTLVACAISLLGFPPLLGFLSKAPLFTSAIRAGEIPLVIVLGLNSAIAAWYYLRLAGAAMLQDPGPEAESVRLAPYPSRRVAAVVGAVATIALAVFANWLMEASDAAAEYTPADSIAAEQAPPADRAAAEPSEAHPAG